MLHWCSSLRLDRAFPSGARQTLTLFIFGLLHGLTGRPPFLQLRRGDEASGARGNVLAGLPPVVIILTYNLQSNSPEFSLVQSSFINWDTNKSKQVFIQIKLLIAKLSKVQGSFKETKEYNVIKICKSQWGKSASSRYWTIICKWLRWREKLV